jgi:Tol biopolymer transport system component
MKAECRACTSEPTSAIYVIRVTKQGVPVQDGLPNPQRLTFNNEDERAPSWSPDGTRIAYMCHNRGRGFEIPHPRYKSGAAAHPG